jgi:hypothetical protein
MDRCGEGFGDGAQRHHKHWRLAVRENELQHVLTYVCQSRYVSGQRSAFLLQTQALPKALLDALLGITF